MIALVLAALILALAPKELDRSAQTAVAVPERDRYVDSLAVQAGGAKKTAKPYVSEEGGFTIEFPIPPDESSGVRQFPSGTMKIHHASCLDGAIIYGASYAEFSSRHRSFVPVQGEMF